jgi:ABC-type branched-subunit amino acid transport system ATPase component
MIEAATAVTPAIAARQLRAGYGKTVVVHGIDLDVRPGSVVALLGRNGAGKTTTLLTLSGDLPAVGGEVLFAGRTTTSPLHERARRGLSLVTERRAVFTRLTVNENLRVGRCDRQRALELFPELEPHLKRRVGLLSGGQQQMLSLARALSRRPSVLLADELSLGLAPRVVDRLLQAVRDAANEGIAVLVVEQHVPKVLDIADHVYVMHRGAITLQGSAGEIRGRIGELYGSYIADRSQPAL